MCSNFNMHCRALAALRDVPRPRLLVLDTAAAPQEQAQELAQLLHHVEAGSWQRLLQRRARLRLVALGQGEPDGRRGVLVKQPKQRCALTQVAPAHADLRLCTWRTCQLCKSPATCCKHT